MSYVNILKILNERLKYFNYSENTISSYNHYVKEFLESVGKYTQHLVSSDVQNYLNEYNFTSVSQQNQIISSIKFFYEKVLDKKYSKINFHRPRTRRRLPIITEKEFLLTKISKIENLKHRAILSLAFSVGLRVSEVVNLRIEDIDSKRMIISIRRAKGDKDRIVPLSTNILTLLREYWRVYKPTDYLFNGQKLPRYTASSCNKLVKKYLGENYRFHLLRHSCFTSLLESGTGLRVIQKLAGHSSSKTTEIYTHVSRETLSRIPLPI